MTTFTDLHHGPLPLLLPNAWDVPSALAFVAEGHPAIGTTSFGVASSLGRPDGGRATREANLRLADPTAFAAKVAAVKRRNPGVFVNARVDTYWLHQDDTVDATLTRAVAYAEAGADGVFVPGGSGPEALSTITGTLTMPVNVLAIPGGDLGDLGDLGVRRVSTGSLPYRAAIAATTRAAAAIRDGREPPTAAAYDDLQARLSAYAGSVR